MCTWRLHDGAVAGTELGTLRAADVATVDEINGEPCSVKRRSEEWRLSAGVWVFSGAGSESLCSGS